MNRGPSTLYRTIFNGIDSGTLTTPNNIWSQNDCEVPISPWSEIDREFPSGILKAGVTKYLTLMIKDISTKDSEKI